MVSGARAVFVALFVAILAAPAQAAVVGFSGSLGIKIGFLPAINLDGAGNAVVNGSNGFGPLTAIDIPVAAFQTNAYGISVTTTSAAPIRGIQLTLANGAGHLAGVPNAGFGGAMPLAGFAKVCLFGPCTAAIANVNVPISVVGQGGSAFVTAAVNLTVQGAPWTTGLVPSPSGAAGGGIDGSPTPTMARLVTPIFISTNIAASAVIPATAYLVLNDFVVPEPGTFVLLGSGIAALVAFGRSRPRA